MTLHQINKKIHSIIDATEMNEELNQINIDIQTILNKSSGYDFSKNYHHNHTSRELYKKLKQFGLGDKIDGNRDSGGRLK